MTNYFLWSLLICELMVIIFHSTWWQQQPLKLTRAKASPCCFLQNSKAEWWTCVTRSRNVVHSSMPKIPVHTHTYGRLCMKEKLTYVPFYSTIHTIGQDEPNQPWYDWGNVLVKMTGQFLEGAILQHILHYKSHKIMSKTITTI